MRAFRPRDGPFDLERLEFLAVAALRRNWREMVDGVCAPSDARSPAVSSAVKTLGADELYNPLAVVSLFNFYNTLVDVGSGPS